MAWVLGVSTAGLYAHHLFFDAEWPSGMTTTEAVEAGVGATVLCWLALGFFYLLGTQARQRRDHHHHDQARQRAADAAGDIEGGCRQVAAQLLEMLTRRAFQVVDQARSLLDDLLHGRVLGVEDA